MPGAPWPKANAPANTTTTTETRSDNRRIPNLPWFVSTCHHGSCERANLPRAATATGTGPSVQMPDAAIDVSGVLTAPVGLSRQERIMPKACGQHIGRRYRVSGGPQQAGIRYTWNRLAQLRAVPDRGHELHHPDGNGALLPAAWKCPKNDRL